MHTPKADDEVIFGWPIMQDPDIDRYLVIVCDDVKRKGEGRLLGLQQVCSQFGIKLVCAGNVDADFYSLPTRYADFVLNDAIRLIRSMIAEAILNVAPDYVFTHNMWGEYGHGDHRLVHQLVAECSCRPPMLITDLCEENKCHHSYRRTPVWFDWISKMEIDNSELNGVWYLSGMETYLNNRGWTWKKELPEAKNSTIYLLK